LNRHATPDALSDAPRCAGAAALTFPSSRWRFADCRHVSRNAANITMPHSHWRRRTHTPLMAPRRFTHNYCGVPRRRFNAGSTFGSSFSGQVLNFQHAHHFHAASISIRPRHFVDSAQNAAHDRATIISSLLPHHHHHFSFPTPPV